MSHVSFFTSPVSHLYGWGFGEWGGGSKGSCLRASVVEPEPEPDFLAGAGAAEKASAPVLAPGCCCLA